MTDSRSRRSLPFVDKAAPFVLKTKEELDRMSFQERARYFEDLLANLRTRRDEPDEAAREDLARIPRRRSTEC